MNWLPSLNINGNVTTRNSRFSRSVVLRYLRHKRKTGRYRARVNRDTGFSDSGLSLPLINITISTGTNVIASTDEKPTASVFVQANGRNRRPSCASNRKTGTNDMTMMIKEKNSAGPTCFAPSMRIFRRSGSENSERCRSPVGAVTMGASDVLGTGAPEESVSPVGFGSVGIGRSDK